jgi:uncharacterized membrane protein YhaH (DUF805 family)
MTALEWAIRPLRRYADFGGRSPRAEYWWFALLILLAVFAFVLLSMAALGGPTDLESDSRPVASIVLVILALACLGIFIPSIAVQVRRMHDQDMSGWWVLLFAIPYIGPLIGLVFMLIPGTRGPNRFGPDPYETEITG